jgi:lysophospholipase L1-like esterase
LAGAALRAAGRRLRAGRPGRAALPSGAAVLAALVCAVGTLVAVGGTGSSATGTTRSGAVAPQCAPSWVTAWQPGVQRADPGLALGGRTLRMLVRPQVSGSEVRLRLSNRYGSLPLVVGSVSAARSGGGAALQPGTVTPVGFGGLSAVVVAPGAEVVSDPVPLVVEAGRPLAVSMFLPVQPSTVTGHAVALQTSWVSRPGDFALAPDPAGFDVPVGSWLVLAGVDVLAPRPVGTVVAIGDSITDGVGSRVDADERWSDALTERLASAGGPAVMSVLNAGISGNQLLADRRDVGDSPLTRFERDVGATTATDVVLHIGTNDIAAGRGAAEIINGLVRFTDRARTTGTAVFLTTITPADHAAHGSAAAAAVREEVNGWIRTRGRQHADGVFDFAAAVADPQRPTRLAPPFDSGDGLHPSAAGYRALADAVDIDRLSGSPCLADGSAVRVRLSAN